MLPLRSQRLSLLLIIRIDDALELNLRLQLRVFVDQRLQRLLGLLRSCSDVAVVATEIVQRGHELSAGRVGTVEGGLFDLGT